MRKKSKFLFAGMAAVMTVSLLAPIAGAASSLWSTYAVSRQIGEGTVYTQVSAQNQSGQQKVNYIEYIPNSTVTPIVAYGSNLYGKSTITTIQKYLEQQGMDVVGGINADFFDLSSGIPIGIVINQGKLITSSLSQYAVGFMQDGSAVIGKPSINMAIQGPDGKFFTIDYYNKTRNNVGLFLLDSNFASETKISSSGTNIILERVDDTPVTVGGRIELKVVGTERTSASTKIAANQMVLTISDKGPTARFPSYNPGDTVHISITPADARWAQADYAVGGKNLVSAGTVSTAGIDGGSSKAPRTAVGIKENGSLLFYEMDGRQSSYSVGFTAAQLAEEMKSLGCTDVLCLDGGGSSAMVVQEPGDSEAKVVNKPSDGSLRACANYIMLVNKAPSDGVPAILNIYPTYQYILPGASTTLSAKATDSGYHPTALPTDVTYAAEDGMGTVSGNVYTAGMETGKATVKAASATASGSYEIFITSVLSSLSLTRNGSAVSGLTLNGGETVDLDAVAAYRNQTVASKDSTLHWSVSGNIGTITADGVFTAVNSPASGSITVSYEGVSKTIPVTVGMGKMQNYKTISNFEDWDDSPTFSVAGDSDLSMTSDVSQIYQGRKSLKLTLASNSERLSVAPQSTSDFRVLTCWANSDSDHLGLQAIFQDAAGQELPVSSSAAYPTNANGYTSLSYSIPESAVSFVGFQVQADSGNTLYMDHVLLSESPIINQLPPKLTVTDAPKTAKAGESVTIKTNLKSYFGSTTLSPNDIAAYVDGEEASGSYNTQTGAYYITTPALTGGIHRVTLEAFDISGMGITKSFDITVGASVAAFADTQGNWATYYINSVAEKQILIGDTQNGVSYFHPKRNLTRSEFAVIMTRYLGLSLPAPGTSVDFADQDSIPSWAVDAVNSISASGIMTGSIRNGESYFNPNANITRSEVMTVISKSLKRGYYTQTTNFTDQSQIPSWAAPHVQYLASLELIHGYADGSIKPLANITREEIAKMIYDLT